MFLPAAKEFRERVEAIPAVKAYREVRSHDPDAGVGDDAGDDLHAEEYDAGDSGKDNHWHYDARDANAGDHEDQSF